VEHYIHDLLPAGELSEGRICLREEFAVGFGASALRDILKQGDDVVYGAVAVTQGPYRDDAVNDATILPSSALLQFIGIDLAGEDATELGDIRYHIIRVSEVYPGAMQQLTSFVAEDLADLVIDLEDPFRRRCDRHADQAQLKVTAKAFFRNSQSLLRLLECRNIQADRGQSCDVPVSIAEG
jgi:hypothetical protein